MMESIQIRNFNKRDELRELIQAMGRFVDEKILIDEVIMVHTANKSVANAVTEFVGKQYCDKCLKARQEARRAAKGIK